MSEAKPSNRARRIAVALTATTIPTAIITSLGADSIMHATGIFPPRGQPMSDALFALALAYRTIFGTLGGYVVARLAPDHPMRLALWSGLFGLIVSTAGAVATWNAGPAFGPRWYPLALTATTIPTAWAGAKIFLARG